MIRQEIKSRESILKYDKKSDDFSPKREKRSKKFGKARLLELFENAYDAYYKSSDRRFYAIFMSNVFDRLKSDKGVKYFRKEETQRELMSLFGKYRHILDNHGKDILKTFESPQEEEMATTTRREGVQLSLFDSLEDSQEKSAEPAAQTSSIAQNPSPSEEDHHKDSSPQDWYNDDTDDEYEYRRQKYNNQ